jgi:transcriptional regulator with XRE-family HTH domain
MKYNEKLRSFFKDKGYKQKEIAALLGYSPAMIGRYLKGSDKVNSDFIQILIKKFPEIDLQYIFSEDEDQDNTIMKEPPSLYQMDQKDMVLELQLIEDKIAVLKNVLARKCHE